MLNILDRYNNARITQCTLSRLEINTVKEEGHFHNKHDIIGHYIEADKCSMYICFFDKNEIISKITPFIIPIYFHEYFNLDRYIVTSDSRSNFSTLYVLDALEVAGKKDISEEIRQLAIKKLREGCFFNKVK